MPRVNVSVKLSSLYSQFDPIDPDGTSRGGARPAAADPARGPRQRAFVNVDMEQYAYKDLTLRIFREVLDEDEFRDWPDVGIAIQAYLRDAERDLRKLARLGAAARHAASGCGWSRAPTGITKPSWPPSRAGRCRSSRTSGRPTPTTNS